MARNYKIYLGGEWVTRKSKIKVHSPYDGTLVGTVSAASKEDFSLAIDRAHKAFATTRELPSYKREAILRAIADGLEKNLDKFAATMSRELGKAIKDSKLEVTRSVGVFRASAEEAKRIGGEITDLDWAAGSEKRMGLVRRFPRGVIGGISPFNFPLNLVAHKVGPAIASGNTIVLKPASSTPLVALLLAEIIDKTELPKGALSILPASPKETSPLLEDDRVKLITFTGSGPVGWWIKNNAGKKPVVLELGGNAGVAVADDADIDLAVQRILYGSFASAGQSCISVQRIYLHEKIHDKFLKAFVRKVKKLKTGDPLDPKTDIGAMVDRQSVENTMKMVRDAVKEGAKVVAGGKAKGSVMQPTLLTNVKPSMAACSEEAFAPLAVVLKYKNFKDVVSEINNSFYGLQAGVFTNRLKDVFHAFNYIDAGGIVVNDVPTYRADHQPYGGMKDSGIGREGIRYTIEDMTEIKILAMNLK
ncbi:MAG: aldehyde dehydrogenase family protein [bacterium]|nr:aldehyde dehydrogenase family protein [bacterium]